MTVLPRERFPLAVPLGPVDRPLLPVVETGLAVQSLEGLSHVDKPPVRERKGSVPLDFCVDRVEVEPWESASLDLVADLIDSGQNELSDLVSLEFPHADRVSDWTVEWS